MGTSILAPKRTQIPIFAMLISFRTEVVFHNKSWRYGESRSIRARSQYQSRAGAARTKPSGLGAVVFPLHAKHIARSRWVRPPARLGRPFHRSPLNLWTLDRIVFLCARKKEGQFHLRHSLALSDDSSALAVCRYASWWSRLTCSGTMPKKCEAVILTTSVKRTSG